MTDRDFIKSLLRALRAGGRIAEAEAYEAEFAKRAWRGIGRSDVARVVGVLSRDYAPDAGSGSPPGTELEPTPAAPDRPQAHPALVGFAPFVGTLPHGFELVAAVDAMTRAVSFDGAAEALRRIFLELLGYERTEIDISGRLGSKKGLMRARVLARHQGFSVVLAELPYASRYTNQYQPVFRLQGDSLLVAFTPEPHTMRLVYRYDTTSPGMSLRFRTLVGWPYPGEWDGHVEDNLLTWARRFALLRPGFQDDAAALRGRVQHALDVAPGDLAARWPSVRLAAEDDLPGLSWEGAPAREVASFLQVGVEPEARLHWGLEACFRAVFPIMSWKSGLVVHYVGHALDDVPAADTGPERWLRAGTTRAATLRLDLLLASRGAEDEGEAVSVVACVPVPDSSGRFVLEGELFVHRPTIGAGGTLVTRLVPGDDDDPLAEYLALVQGHGATRPEDEQEPGDDSAEPGDEALEQMLVAGHGEAAASASLRALLERATSRRLFGLAAAFRETPAEWLTCANDLRFLLRRMSDGAGAVYLGALGYLRRALTPLEPGAAERLPRRILDSRDANDSAPPAWACLDLSSAMGDGQWWPVAGARLHPCGELAIPRGTGSPGEVVLEVARETAFLTNPRAGGDAVDGPDKWWIASQLASWAACAPGDLVCPLDAVEARELPPDLCVVRTRAGTLDARVHPRALPRTSRSESLLLQDVPAHGGKVQARLRVDVGTRVAPGDVWLEVAGRAWPGSTSRPRHRYEAVVDAIRGQRTDKRVPWRLFVPGDVSGVVTRSACEPLHDRHGSVRAYRFSLAVESELRPGGSIVLPDGRDVAITGWLEPQDAPWRADGRMPDLVVWDPRVPEDTLHGPVNETSVWFSPEDGDIDAVIEVSGARWIPPSAAGETVGPNACLNWRLIDGGGLAARGGEPALSEVHRRWLHLAYPRLGHALNVAEVAWQGGAPGYWPNLLDAAAGASLVPPSLGPAAWSAATTSSGVESVRRYRRGQSGSELIDPSRSKATAIRAQRAESSRDLMEVCCSCGALRGLRHVGTCCRACGHPAVLRAVSLPSSPVYEARLPVRLLHPWWKPMAAGVLGLLTDELTELLRAHDPSRVFALVDSALSDPTKSLEQRLERAARRRERVLVGSALWTVRRWLADASSEPGSCLWLWSLPVVAPQLMPSGYPAGASELMAAPLLARYRRVRLHIEQLEKIPVDAPPVLRVSALTALQTSVDELFGTEASAREDGVSTLAGLVHRLWPPTRPGHLATAVPGLFIKNSRSAVEADSRASARSARARVAFREALAASGTPDALEAAGRAPEAGSGKGEPGLWLVTPWGEEPLPRPAPARRAPGEPSWWSERAALAALVGRHAASLAVLAGRLRTRGSNRQEGSAEDSQGTEPARGRLDMAQLVRASARSDGRPSLLLDLLDGRLPLQLPRSADAALAEMVARLAEACPGHELGLDRARRTLATVLCGWWRGPVTVDHPLGWQWCTLAEAPVSPWRRAVPGLRSRAWRLWSDLEAVALPVRWLLLSGDCPNDALLEVLGFPGELPPRALLEADPSDVAFAPAELDARSLLPAGGDAESRTDVLLVATRGATALPAGEGWQPSAGEAQPQAADQDVDISVWHGSPAAWHAARGRTAKSPQEQS